jgi:hypothetical protein
MIDSLTRCAYCVSSFAEDSGNAEVALRPLRQFGARA